MKNKLENPLVIDKTKETFKIIVKKKIKTTIKNNN